ncbi:MAG: glycosyltransferase [Rhodospirillaceae bacterium]|nr:glycosyltransferase [Rhodospirillaceae bacterium]
MPALIPSAIISILNPLRLLEARGEVEFSFDVSTAWSRQKIRDADIVVFCRSNSPEDLAALIEAERSGKPVVYDIDDDFFTIPMELAIGRRMRLGLALPIVRQFATTSAVVRTYSTALHDHLAAFGARAMLFDAYFDAGDIAPIESAADDEFVRIVFASARDAVGASHQAAMAALRRLSESLDNVEIHLWRPPDATLDGCRGVHVHRPTSDYAAFLKQLTALRPSIGIAPADDTAFFAGKTNNKFREYGGLGIAGVYSDVPLYRGSVADGETGLLVENTSDAWFEALRRLAKDRAFRCRIAKRARQLVTKRYSIDAFLGGWRNCIAIAQRSETRRAPVPLRPWRLVLPSHAALAKATPADRFYASVYENLAIAAGSEAEIVVGRIGSNLPPLSTLVLAANSPPDNAAASAARFLIVDLCLSQNRAIEMKWCRFVAKRPGGGMVVLRPDQRDTAAASLGAGRAAAATSMAVMADPREVDSHFDLDGNAARQWAVVERCRSASEMAASGTLRGERRTRRALPRVPAVAAWRRLRNGAARRVHSVLGFSRKVGVVIAARSAEPLAALIVRSAPDRRSNRGDEFADGLDGMAATPGVGIMDDWTFMTAPALPPLKAVIVISRGGVSAALAQAIRGHTAPRQWIHVGPRSQADDAQLADLATTGVVVTRANPAEGLIALNDAVKRAIGAAPPVTAARRALGGGARLMRMVRVGSALLHNQFDRWRLAVQGHRKRRGGAGPDN